MTDAQRISQLEQQLANWDSHPGADWFGKIDLLNDLAWALSDVDLQRAYALAETAHALATSPDDGAPPYEAGIAYSLRTQGYLNQRRGDYSLGLSQLLKAQALFEAQELVDGLPDVFDGISGIYGQMDMYPEALDATYKQLEAAESIGDKRRIANAYNNLASIYMETRDYERAEETLHRNLELAAETSYARIECLTHLNLAETYLLTGDHELACEHGSRGLRISEEAGFALFEAYALGILGKASARSGDVSHAIAYLEQALAASKKLGSQVTESLILLDLGRVYRDLGSLDRALDILQHGLAVAHSINARSEVFNAYLLLSEVYEQMGDTAQALAHFKQYQAFKELVAGERADQRLKVLQVAYDTERTKKEAEVAALRSVELQQQVDERTAELRDTVDLLRAEIEERQRAERALQEMAESLEQQVVDRTEELAAFFDLILLAGQGISLPEILDQVLPRVTEISRSEAVAIDLLNAEGSALQLVAGQNVPEDIPALLPTAELPPEIQRWLQRPNDPLSNSDLEFAPSLRSAFHVAGLQTFLGAQIRIGQRISGVLSCFRFSESGYSVDETALILALAQQIGIILEITDLRASAEKMAVWEERQRLARDLHDSVTQSLYSLALFSRAGREAAEDGDTARLTHSLAELENTTLDALREMRLLLYELRPTDLQQEGLKRAIMLRLNTVERRVGLQLDVQLDEIAGLPASHEVHLYHIIVEALNNVVKHAAATRFTLQLVQTDGQVRLWIADDGRGFDASQVDQGLGLATMRERVAQLGGQLAIASEPGRGTQLEAVIPYQAEVS